MRVSGSLAGRRIMIVEDELLVAMDTQALILKHGGQVVGPFSRIPAALDAIQSHGIDAAVLDINIAGTPSFAVADDLAARDIPFVFCTGYSREGVAPRFRTRPTIEKPIAEQELVTALNQVFASMAPEASGC